MTDKAHVLKSLARTAGGGAATRTATSIPGQPLIDGLGQMHKAYTDYQMLREQEQTKRLAILADRDATLEQIRAQRDVIAQALSASFELRRTGLQAQIQAMDKAIDRGDSEALHVVMEGMVKTIQASPFKSVEDMRQQLSDKNFVLRLK